MKREFSLIIFFVFVSVSAMSQHSPDSAFIADNFIKMERMIPMRDGVRLFTSIYIPKDQNEKYPFLMERTPYSCSPYGENNFRPWGLGPNSALLHEKYIFVYQDVRGRYKSEGDFDEMTPAKDVKKSKKDTDESSDTFDTIEWLLKNIKNNNGQSWDLRNFLSRFLCFCFFAGCTSGYQSCFATGAGYRRIYWR